MVKNRRRHTAAFKFRVALEALEGSKTISQLSSEHEIHANLTRAWKRQLLDDGLRVFASNGERKADAPPERTCSILLPINRMLDESVEAFFLNVNPDSLPSPFLVTGSRALQGASGLAGDRLPPRSEASSGKIRLCRLFRFPLCP